MPVRPVISIVVVPNPEIIAQAFFATAARLQHMEEPMKMATDRYSQEMLLNFEAEGRPTQWEPLAASTILERERLGFSDGPILVRTGDLEASTQEWSVGQTGQTAVAELDTVAYGHFHLEGAHGWGDSVIPIRDWAYIPDEAQSEIDVEFANWATEPLQNLPSA